MQPNQQAPEQGQPNRPPEQIPNETGREAIPAPQERQTPAGDSAAQGDGAFTTLPLPQPVEVAPSPPTPKTDDTPVSGPAIADDVDLIEKEWVDRAKSIVNEHKHDPYNQEKEVSRLKTDYRQKRYGKTSQQES